MFERIPPFINAFDHRILSYALGMRSDAHTLLARIVTHIGDWEGITGVGILSAVLLWRAGRREEAVKFAMALAIGITLYWILKLVFGRQRPPEAFWLVLERDSALPSGHALMATICFGGLAWVVWHLTPSPIHRTLAIIAAAIASLAIGASRIYLGVHWPSDVIAGFVVGLGVLAAILAR